MKGNPMKILKSHSGLTALMVLYEFGAWSAASTIQFSATSYTVSENAGDARFRVQRSAETNTAVSVDYETIDGTAKNGVHYTAVSGTVSFGAGETLKDLRVPILNNSTKDGRTTFRIALGNPTGGAELGTPADVTVLITDNDVGFQFGLPSYRVAEDAGNVVVGVARDDDGNAPVAVDYRTTDGTAICGVDYAGATNTLAFGATERFKLLRIPIVNNTMRQSDRAFTLTLGNPVGAPLGPTKGTSVSITDNDQGFRFESFTCGVAEDAGAALIHVLRGTDDVDSRIAVDYRTTNGTATAGSDYLAVSGTLTFEPGEAAKLVSIPIINDGVSGLGRNFQIGLSNPSSGAALSKATVSTITILDNDPGVGFESPAYTNDWGQTADFAVTVLRGNDGYWGSFSVDFATSNLTAVAGLDFEAVSGTLVFGFNEMAKSLHIPLLAAGSTPKRFRVTLFNASGGAALGLASTTVTIQRTTSIVASPISSDLRIRPERGINILEWAGGGLLQRADSLSGPWQTLPSAQSPCSASPATPTAFYRVKQPRPVELFIPSSYDGSPIPLVIGLHGGGGNGEGFENWLHFKPLAESRGFLYCCPNGNFFSAGAYVWYSFCGKAEYSWALGWPNWSDDVAYLRGLIEDIGRRFAVDQKRIFLIGHSNGAAMADRMAHECPDLVAGIAGSSGPWFPSLIDRLPTQPVNVLHIHGTSDEIVNYMGSATGFVSGQNWPPYLSAAQHAQLWADFNGAKDPVTDPLPTLELTTGTPNPDTLVTRYATAPPGGAVELWTIMGANHGPAFTPQFSARVIDWFLSHPKP
jgi:poly(3-hydroxybutyrate) depolymerase